MPDDVLDELLRRDHLCQVCGTRHPLRYLFDLKESVPGGRRVTCAQCTVRLDGEEITRLRAELTRREGECAVPCVRYAGGIVVYVVQPAYWKE